MSINRVIVSGNLTRDPELRATAGGTSLLVFGIAVNDRVRNSSTGEWEDYANFVDCVMFGNRADSMSRILRKGMKVMLEGRLHYSSWEDKDGHRRSKIEVTVDNLDLPPRGQGQQAPQQQQQQRQFASQYNQQNGYQQGGYQQQPSYQGYQQMQPAQAQPAQMQYGGAVVSQPQITPDVYDEDIPFS